MTLKRPLNVYLKFIIDEPLARLIRFLPYPHLRTFLLKVLGARISWSTVVYNTLFFGMEFGKWSNLETGKHVHIGRDCIIDLNEKVILEDNVILSPRVTLLTHASPGMHSPMLEYYPEIRKPITIKKGSWIGAHATILPGVVIGEMSVIAAGAVVTSDVEPYSVYAGVPAVRKKGLK